MSVSSPTFTGSTDANRLWRSLGAHVAWYPVLVGVLLAGNDVLAEEPDDTSDASDDSSRLERPELTSFVEAPYPEKALEARSEGTVVLILTIDSEGQVTRARVERGPGDGLNRAAREAAEQFVFEPARRNGEPVGSKIRYRYEFELPDGAETDDPDSGDESAPADSSTNETPAEEPASSSEEAIRGRLGGTVRGPENDQSTGEVRVRLTGPDGTTRTLRTERDGTFRTERLPTGPYRVVATAESGARADLKTEILPGETTEVDLRLQPSSDSETLQVTVHGESRAETLESSARAVDVIETERADEMADDMGDVVSEEEGVNVRRTGGLGSGSRFSLNGLGDNQVRFFFDGIPLEFAGFPAGLANVPVNLVDRIDLYKGVVPVRYGADALGGAVDLVPEARPTEPGFAASYQVGSFDTHRLTLHGQTAQPDSKWYARSNAFFDYSENDYDVDVEVADRSGQIYDATARRFHDTYRSVGVALEAGTVDRSWADRLSARVFVSDYARDLQHNLIMTVPYGEARYGETAAGGILRYDHEVTSSLQLDVAAGYNFSETWFEDQSECYYDWFGRCSSERESPGEIGRFASDRRIWEHAGFGRFNATWSPFEVHDLRLSVAPTYVTRTGEERADTPRAKRDPFEAERDLFDLVAGVELQTDLLGGRLQNIGFFKDYLQISRSDETLPSGKPVSQDRTTHQLGAGNSLRYSVTDWFRAKASYEWATRLPSAVELFGNGARIQPSPELRPERSHNANLELALDKSTETAGDWRASLTGFFRSTSHLMVLIGGARSLSYQNVLKARATGVEAAVGWTSPTELVAIDLNGTYVDLRNASRKGTFGDFYGDRIPNRPYLYANGRLQLRESDVLVDGDTVTATWKSRYVHEYFRGWASLGRREFKQVIPSQWLQSIALTYGLERKDRSLSLTLEMQNVTDEKAYDFYGVQQPGRAFYLKSTLEL